MQIKIQKFATILAVCQNLLSTRDKDKVEEVDAESTSIEAMRHARAVGEQMEKARDAMYPNDHYYGARPTLALKVDPITKVVSLDKDCLENRETQRFIEDLKKRQPEASRLLVLP